MPTSNRHLARRHACGRLKPLAAAVALAAAFCALPGPAAAQAPAAASYSIPPGPLAEALNRFAQQSGAALVVDTARVRGLQSPGLQGRYGVEDGFAALLRGTGLALGKTDAGYVLVAAPQGAQVPAAAGGSTATATLREVTVTAQAERSATTEGTGSYAARGATLFKGAQSPKDIPQSVTVITRQQLDDQGLNTVTDALAQSPGTYFRKRPNGGSDVYLRGFSTDTLQYDGVPLKRYHSFGNDLSASSVYLDRIEVLRGAQGLLEGAGNPAGSVNLVRKRGLAERKVTVEGRMGSWDTYGTRVDAGGPLNAQGTLRGRAVLDYEGKKSFLDTVWDRNLNLYGALDLDITPDTTMGLGVAHARLKGNSTLYGGVPRFEDGHAIALPRSAYIGAGWNEAIRRETQLFFDLSHRFNADWTLKASAVSLRDGYDATTAYENGEVAAGGTTVDGIGYIYDNASTNRGFDVHVDGRLNALGMAHEVVLGANYSKVKRDDRYTQYWVHAVYDVYQPNHDPLRFAAFNPSEIWDQNYDVTQKGVYGLWRSHLSERATLMAGGRASWYDYAGHGISQVDGHQSSSAMQESGNFTPYGGFVYALTPQWSAYASYAAIFNPQSATDAQRQVLPPMTGKAYEAGVKGELLDGALDVSMAAFRIDQNNRAVTDYGSPKICGSGGASYCSKPAGKVRIEGFEIEAHGELARGLQVSGGYTYSRNKYVQDANSALIGMPFDYLMPRHLLRLWTGYRLPGDLSAWQVGGGLAYRSAQRTNSTTKPNPVQGGYTVWGARVAYQVSTAWSVALNIDNLFDKRYYGNIDSDYWSSYVGEPRKFLLTLRGSF